MTLVDSDILIWLMRGEVRAKVFLETLPAIALSVVNHIELIQGMRNRRELKALRDFTRLWKVTLPRFHVHQALAAVVLRSNSVGDW